VSLDEQDDSSGNERNVSPEKSTEIQIINKQRLGVNSSEERADDDEEDIDDEVDFDKT